MRPVRSLTKKQLFTCCAAILLLLGFTAGISDDDPFAALLKKIETHLAKYPQEKVHLHTDKTAYNAGEEIWFRAYVVNAVQNEPTQLSTILYVELIDPQNKIQRRLSLPIDSGMASGSITLPDATTPGMYRIRAYTTYMRNFDNSYFFNGFILIGNPPAVPDTAAVKKQGLDIQFFPEGGNMVAGQETLVGVKTLNASGLGINISGYIINSEKQKITDFSTEHAGMGSFKIMPEEGEHYKAVIIKNDDITLFDLPPVLKTGFTLSVDNLKDEGNVLVHIAASKALIKGKPVYLTVQSNGVVYYKAAPILDEPMLVTTIPAKSFPPGIIQFTLFSEEMVPVAERLIFMADNDPLAINAAVNPVPAIARQGSLALSVTDSSAAPVEGNFSVAITKNGEDNEDEATSIFSNLLLTSDIKGFIEQPNYYFNNITPAKKKQLDNLLLTQGWRRFSWQQVLKTDNTPMVFSPEKGFEIKGQITDLADKPLPNCKVNLVSAKKGLNFALDTLTDADGRFVFDRLNIEDSVTLFLKAVNKNSNKVKIRIDPELSGPDADSIRLISVSAGGMITMALKTDPSKPVSPPKLNNGIKEIAAVEIKGGIKQPKAIVNIPHSKNRNGSADYVITKEKFEHEKGTIFSLFNSIPGVMMENGLIVRARSNTVTMSPKQKGKKQPMLIMLDGVATSQDVLTMMPASSVEGIEILASNYNTAIYEDGYWGVVIITTKMGGNEKQPVSVSSNIAKIYGRGFSAVKSFYEPAFDSPNNTDAAGAGQTVYWNPELKTNKSGKANINFSHGNVPGKYHVVIEGMDKTGRIGRKTLNFNITG